MMFYSSHLVNTIFDACQISNTLINYACRGILGWKIGGGLKKPASKVLSLPSVSSWRSFKPGLKLKTQAAKGCGAANQKSDWNGIYQMECFSSASAENRNYLEWDNQYLLLHEFHKNILCCDRKSLKGFFTAPCQPITL